MKIKFVLIATSILLIGSVFYIAFGDQANESRVGDEVQTPMLYDNIIAAPYIPASLDFAGEKVPLDVYWVRENFDKEIIIMAYQHSRTLHILKRSPRFFPTIEKILKEEGVPEDFKYLCVAESGLENVVSPAKAEGYWQFLQGTGKNYGLTINDEVDERYDLEKSTRAACKYLKESKKKFGSWTMAAAAYNVGDNGLQKSVDRQVNDNYWDLFLNQETARYVYRIVAYKMIFENPSKYGIKLCTADLYYPIPCKNYEVKESIPDLPLFAKEQGITYLELKRLNPWLRNTKLTITPDRYTIQLPKKAKISYLQLLPEKENQYKLLEKL